MAAYRAFTRTWWKMNHEYESEEYAWSYDSLYGVGRFVRKSDGAMTYLETGSDCQDMRRQLRRLDQKAHSPRYPNQAPSFNSVFNSIASEYEFHAD
jgi:hypothetical protein